MPNDFPPKSTVWRYFDAWRGDGTLSRIHDALRQQVRQREGRQATPSAASDAMLYVIFVMNMAWRFAIKLQWRKTNHA